MKVSIIVAAAENNVIGKNNDLIWHLPDDLKFFKRMTLGHFILMGKNTFHALGKPLPGRTHLVISRTLTYEHDRVLVFKTVEEAIDYARKQNEDELFITGGGKIYEYCLKMNLVDKVYLTKVHREYDGDTWFSGFIEEDWQQLTKVEHPQDEHHIHAFTFLQYSK